MDYASNAELGSLVSDIMEGRIVNQTELDQRMKQVKLIAHRYFHLMLVSFDQSGSRSPIPWNYVISQLQYIFPYSNITTYNGDILLINSGSGNTKTIAVIAQQAKEQGATVALPYGVEGFAPMRHLEKEDKSKARQGETLDFKVIEFSKENKKIIVSHTRVFQDNIETERQKSENEEAKKERATKKTVKKINETLEKTTLGDLSVLASLKEEIEKEQKGE